MLKQLFTSVSVASGRYLPRRKWLNIQQNRRKITVFFVCIINVSQQYPSDSFE